MDVQIRYTALRLLRTLPELSAPNNMAPKVGGVTREQGQHSVHPTCRTRGVRTDGGCFLMGESEKDF